MLVTARHWRRTDDGGVQCVLCPHVCRVGPGRAGLCGARGERNGELKALTYGLISSAHLDPVEKKPLHHFHPGRSIFSIGGWGCNFACVFCQNWSISQRAALEGERFQPERIVAAASAGDSIGIAYTYNEPLIGFEFVMDCARLARAAGLVNVLVTNGYLMPGPTADLLPLVDALNIDIKSMDEGFYRQHCRGSLQPVLDFCRQAVRAKCRVEITNLLIPGLNDGDEQIARLAEWIGENLGEGVPLHLSAYRPEYRLNVPATPIDVLLRAHGICRQRLRYVYLGNVATGAGQDTECPQCGAVIIRRRGYTTQVTGLTGDACSQCGRPADIVRGS